MIKYILVIVANFICAMWFALQVFLTFYDLSEKKGKKFAFGLILGIFELFCILLNGISIGVNANLMAG